MSEAHTCQRHAPRRLWFVRLACTGLMGLSLLARADSPSVSMVFTGDVMLADKVGQGIRDGHDPLQPFASILKQSDIRIANLECVIATGGEAVEDKPYTFRAHPRVLSLLKRHVDAVSLANNHTGDFGHGAFKQMLQLLQQAKLPYAGGGMDLNEAHQPLMFERQGVRIALLAYNEFFPRSFEADVDRPGHAWSDDEQVLADIRNARDKHHADLVITFMHWGFENESRSNGRQQQLARWMIDAGADAVIGSHPHVTQEMAVYKDKPVFYSLGNFVFDGFSSKENNTGWVVRLNMNKTGVTSATVHEAHIDKRGTPRPASAKPRYCWQQGEALLRICAAPLTE
jgi:poly-gamma-glutamate capsule biosynthesis protein CapA/YwtB (metallophosphatase superfamily)